MRIEKKKKHGEGSLLTEQNRRDRTRNKNRRFVRVCVHVCCFFFFFLSYFWWTIEHWLQNIGHICSLKGRTCSRHWFLFFFARLISHSLIRESISWKTIKHTRRHFLHLISFFTITFLHLHRLRLNFVCF